MKKITSLLFVMLLACVTSLQAGKITTVEGITSGKKYYIGATTGTTDYYLSVDGSSTSTSTAGKAVTDKTEAAVFTFTQDGTSWTIRFENGNYLSLKKTTDNGKVVVSSTSSTFTITYNKNKKLLTIACDNTDNKTYAIQKNNSGTQFGSYKKTQTDVWLEEYVDDLPLQALEVSGEPEKMTYYVGETFSPKGLVVTGTYSDGTTTADVTAQVKWEITPAEFTTIGTTSVNVTAKIGNDLRSNVLTINDVQVIDVDKYAKITSAAQLADGQHIIIVSADATFALSTTQKTSNRGAVEVTASESGLITPSSDVEIIRLNAQGAQWELQVSDGYLYAICGDNSLRTQKTNSDAGLWTITYTEAGAVTISTTVSNTKKSETRYIKKNSSSALFSCYTGGQTDIAIFARQYTVTVNSNNESMGTVEGGGDYFENNVATLVATPKDGYKFTGWSNNSELTSATQELTVTASVTITANFAKGETAIESAAVETPAVKTIENGQLVILRDGVKYNAMGVRLQ